MKVIIIVKFIFTVTEKPAVVSIEKKKKEKVTGTGTHSAPKFHP
jgi:actin-like ATPase involved in cell morphogenesis